MSLPQSAAYCQTECVLERSFSLLSERTAASRSTLNSLFRIVESFVLHTHTHVSLDTQPFFFLYIRHFENCTVSIVAHPPQGLNRLAIYFWSFNRVYCEISFVMSLLSRDGNSQSWTRQAGGGLSISYSCTRSYNISVYDEQTKYFSCRVFSNLPVRKTFLVFIRAFCVC